ncbi:MAG: NAD(P)/FAD-dependent oxidoreductase [Candidatus Bathyarchaeota archaeon]|nr:NAD(P)/FAD-dependent oxidoreductase [Candidatus Bathyarchaeota archaeon]
MENDIIVIGAGTAGSMAARTAAELGFDVYLIDEKEQEKIGDKVCGDAVGKHHFDELGVSPPKGSELASKIMGVDICSPDGQTVFRVRGEGLYGFMINRHEFGQRLLNEALDRGAELHDNAVAEKLVIEKGRVVGVELRDKKRNEEHKVHGKIVIDACGFHDTLKKQLPSNWRIETEIEGEDVVACYREIRKLSKKVEEPEYITIYFSQKASPGGYYWIFPKGENLVNVGLGVQMKKGFPNPKKMLYQSILSKPMFLNSEVLKGGGGLTPTRRPMSNMVGNGILFVGDAAYQPNPAHAGGIGPSMIAGKLAAQTACRAIEDGDLSRESLWSYNVEFMRGYGAKAAGLDVFRIFLQKCGDEELNYGMRNRLIKKDDLLKASLGEDLRLNVTEKARRLFRGLRKTSFLRALDKTAKNMKRIKSLYMRYPQPRKFDGWLREVSDVVREMEEMTF